MANNGWIKLHRKFLDWEWYDDHPTQILFIYLLLTTNKNNAIWHGVSIKSGSTLTSINTLATHTKLSKMQIRNSLNKLKTTGEITISATNRYSVITINNYDTYQSSNTQDSTQTTHKIAHKQHTDNTPDNNKQEYKNERMKEILSKDNTSEPKVMVKEYGNKYINETIEYLKLKLGLPALDGTVKANRYSAQRLLNKYTAKGEPVSEKTMVVIKKGIDLAAQNNYWRSRITKVSDLDGCFLKLFTESRYKPEYTNKYIQADQTLKRI